MCHAPQVPGGFAARLRPHSLIETSAWVEEVDEIAIEGVCGPLKRLKLDRAAQLAALEVADSLLTDLHSSGQFSRGHPQCVADRANPPLVRARFPGEWPEPLEAGV